VLITIKADLIAPTAPTLNTPTIVSSSSLSISLGAGAIDVGGLKEYVLERALSSGGTYSEVARGLLIFPFADSGLTANTAYFYRTHAIDNSLNDGPLSSVVNATPVDVIAPSAPTLGAPVSLSSSSIQLILTTASTDTGGSGLASYTLQRATDAGFTLNVVTTGSIATNAFPLSITGLSASTQYFWKLSGVDGAGNIGANSAAVNGTTQGAGGGAGMTHGNNFTFDVGDKVSGTGTTFGNKLQQTPHIWDFGQGTVNTVPSMYGEALPSASSNSAANMQLQNLPYTGAGSTINAPHQFTSKCMVGGHWDSSLALGFFGGWNVGISSIYTRPAAVYYSYWSAYVRCNTAWIFSLVDPDNNFKISAFTHGAGMYNTNNYWYTGQWSGDSTGVSSTSEGSTIIHDTNLPNPDATGHSLFWDGINNPFNAANGWIRVEMIAKWSTGITNGFFQYWENNVRAMNYQGNTDPFYSGAGQVTESMGGYGRSQHGGTGSLRNVRLFADVHKFHQNDGLGRFAVTDNAIYGNSSIIETQPFETWAGPEVKLRWWQGKFPNGATGHIHFRDEVNGHMYFGSRVWGT